MKMQGNILSQGDERTFWARDQGKKKDTDIDQRMPYLIFVKQNSVVYAHFLGE